MTTTAQALRRFILPLLGALTGSLVLPLAPASAAPSNTLVVNEVQTTGTGSGLDEFVELYNTSGSALNVADFKVEYTSSSGASASALFTFPPGSVIPARSYFLIAGAQYPGPADHRRVGSGLAQPGGSVTIRNAAAAVVDRVAWGTVAPGMAEATPAPPPGPGESIHRKPDGRDTDNNGSDFVVLAAPTPRHSGGPAQLNVRDAGFEAASSFVTEGGSVTWTNRGTVTHTVTATNGSFNAALAPGQSFTRAFPTAGPVAYRCTLHPGMDGFVDVRPRSGRLQPLTPARIVDTRQSGLRLAPGETRAFQVAGAGGVPASGATAVVMNVTVTQPTAASVVTVSPHGVPVPTASNLNFVAGQTVANLVTVRLGTGGRINLHNAHGHTHVILDVSGWFDDVTGGFDGRYQPLVPTRLLDTRSGAGALGPGHTRSLTVAGAAGVPASGAAAVVLNVTITQPTATSHVTVWPGGGSMPVVSNVNFVAGQTVANRVVVRLQNGRVNITNAFGNAHMVVDVNGWFTDAQAGGSPGAFTALVPVRLLDTRTVNNPLGAGTPRLLTVAPAAGVPTRATAVVLNVTITQPTAASFLTVYPAGTSVPLASDSNYTPGRTVPNLVVIKIGSNGQVALRNQAGTAHVVVDVLGYVA